MIYIYSVRWPKSLKSSYLFGSKIIFKKRGGVTFKNDQMPPAMSIHFWKSTVRIFNDGFLGELPLLKMETKYKVITKASVVPANSIYLELRFFDERFELMETKIIHGHDEVFEYPLGAFQYEIHLMNINNESLNFEQLIIEEFEASKHQTVQTGGCNYTYILNDSINAKSKQCIEINIEHRVGDILHMPDFSRMEEHLRMRIFASVGNLLAISTIGDCVDCIYERIIQGLHLVSLKAKKGDIIINDRNQIGTMSVGVVLACLLNSTYRNKTIINGHVPRPTNEEQVIVDEIMRRKYK